MSSGPHPRPGVGLHGSSVGQDPAAAEAVRGGLAATFAAYEAGPYQIVLQVSPSEIEGRFDLQGQVAGDGSRAPASTQVVLTSDHGFADRAMVDAFGEFRITGVPEGPCRLAWYGGGERIDLDGLNVGECDDDDGNCAFCTRRFFVLWPTRARSARASTS